LVFADWADSLCFSLNMPAGHPLWLSRSRQLVGRLQAGGGLPAFQQGPRRNGVSAEKHFCFCREVFCYLGRGCRGHRLRCPARRGN
jgi:hypothetical protein